MPCSRQVAVVGCPAGWDICLCSGAGPGGHSEAWRAGGDDEIRLQEHHCFAAGGRDPGAVRGLPRARRLPFLKDPRGTAATGFLLGLAAAALAGSAILVGGLWHPITLVVGVITFGLGVATVWVETNEVLLAAFMAGIAVTYALAEFAHGKEPATESVTPGRLAHRG